MDTAVKPMDNTSTMKGSEMKGKETSHNSHDDKKHEANKDVSITSPETTAGKIAGAISSVLPSDDEDKNKSEKHKPKYILTIDEGVVEKISSLATKNVDGIVDMKGSVFSMIQEGFGGNDQKKGVDADIDDGMVAVELSIILEYGKSALEVFDNIKEAVTGQVKEMTGLELSELTVNVVDVVDKAEYDRQHNNTNDSDAPEKRPAVTISQ